MRSFYYNSLDLKNKTTYDQIVDGLINMKKSIAIKSISNVSIFVQNIITDYPMLFYVDRHYSVTASLFFTSLNPKYIYNQTEVDLLLKKVNQKVNNIISETINSRQTTYDKVIALHDYLTTNVEYDFKLLENVKNASYDYAEAHNIIGALLKNKCVCTGFSLAMKMLCDKIGIECHVVSGSVDNSVFSGNHAWNIVKIDGYYHHVDVTWDRQFINNCLVPSYAYFGLDDESISKDHLWDRRLYPVCDTIPYNYFKVNNSVIQSYAQLEKYFYDNLLFEEQFICFKLKNATSIGNDVKTNIEKAMHFASNRIKNLQLKKFYYFCAQEQLVYVIKLDYNN